jgi:hypothetical protein
MKPAQYFKDRPCKKYQSEPAIHSWPNLFQLALGRTSAMDDNKLVLSIFFLYFNKEREKLALEQELSSYTYSKNM